MLESAGKKIHKNYYYTNWDEVKKTTAIVATSGVAGAAVGTAAGATIGAIAGGLLTDPIGGIRAVPTAAGGAAVGAFIGTIGGSVSAGLTALGTRVAFVILARHKIDTFAIRERMYGI